VALGGEPARLDEFEFVVVPQEIEAGQAGVDVEAGDPERVVVVPQRGRFLAVVVTRGSRDEVGTRVPPGGEPLLWAPVEGGVDVAAVEVDNRRHPSLGDGPTVVTDGPVQRGVHRGQVRRR
jgi:hypothetical protein